MALRGAAAAAAWEQLAARNDRGLLLRRATHGVGGLGEYQQEQHNGAATAKGTCGGAAFAGNRCRAAAYEQVRCGKLLKASPAFEVSGSRWFSN